MPDKDQLPRHLRNAGKKFDYLKEVYKPEPKPDPNAIKHLGMMNDWGRDGKPLPGEYIQCQRKRGRPHKLEVATKGNQNRGYRTYTCTKCKIEWSVDSTD